MRRIVAVALIVSAPLISVLSEPLSAAEKGKAVRYARFEIDGRTAYGVVEGERVREISGDLFGAHEPTDKTHALKDVKLLVPTEPKQVLALAGNYRSHIKGEIPERLKIPQPFLKSIASLTPHESNIVIPKDSSGNVHYEAELVIVIGKKTKNVSPEAAAGHIFGVTAGNDVSERYWQNDPEHKDVQWWRAKASDTFSPCGPFIVTGVNYDDLLLSLRLNGEEKQKERTSHQIHDVAHTVSFISRYMTLYPGDLIFTGTPGTTSAMKPGDVVEVELEGAGVLRNKVVAEE